MLQAQALANRDAAAAQLHAMRALVDANGHAAMSGELQCWHSDAHETATTASHVLRTVSWRQGAGTIATGSVPHLLESWELVEDTDDVTARHTSNESARGELGTMPEVPSAPLLPEGAFAGAVVIEVDVNVTPAKGTVEGTDTEGAVAEAHVTIAVDCGEIALACAAKERSADHQQGATVIMRGLDSNLCRPT